MKHYGDITKLSGYDLPVVDCITGGSPCQDLSVAGLRKGLQGERSGLFMEQIRIIKEMRERDRVNGRAGVFVRPRFCVWENVPGAFSSGTPKGADFAAVIEEFIKVAEPGADLYVCVPDKGWTKSGCYYAEDGSWSIAWRVHDAQFWGVPQRRKRISLVADFGGLAAPEICFIRRGLCGDTQTGSKERQGVAKGVERGTGETEPILLESNQNHATIQSDGISTTLPASMGMGGGYVPMVTGADVYNGTLTGDIAATLNANTGACGNRSGPTVLTPTNVLNDQGGGVMSVSSDVTATLRAQEHGHQPIVYDGANVTNPINRQNPQPGDPSHAPSTDSRNYLVYDASGNGDGEISPTLTEDHQNRISDYTAIAMDVGFFDTHTESVPTLLARQYKDPLLVHKSYQEITGAPMASGYEKQGVQEAANDTCITQNMVRRLTPLECERLQGFPDNFTNIGEWTDSKGKKHKDSDTPRYKALGNSIALPYWFWFLRRISAQYERPATLGSLFDGIGGFPLCWERCNGKGTALWASEIEEFCIAVTKLRFPEGGTEVEC